MKRIFRSVQISAAALVFSACLGAMAAADAAVLKLGPDSCKKCHKAEYAVWADSPHGQSFRKIHKHDKAATIAEKVGGGKMRKNQPVSNAITS